MKRRHLLAAGIGALAAPAIARANVRFPDRTIRLVVPFPAGGATDVVGRMFADKLTHHLGQTVIVDNKSGAAGSIGAMEVRNAKPDGYTLLVATSSTHAINPTAFVHPPYDPVKDFTPITQVSLGSVLLTAPGTAGYGDLKGFVAWAKQQNRPITYGSWGIGSSANVYGEILARDHGVSLTHVPYKGEQPAITDVIGGSLDVTFASPVGAKPQVQSGKLKAIGMTGPGRSSAMPDVATFAEQGYKGFELPIWVAAYAPAGTPKPIVDRLQKEIAAVIRLPDVLPKLIEQGQTPLGNTPEEFAAAFARDAPRWIEFIKASGAKPE